MEQNILDTKTGKVNFADNSQLASLRISDPVLTTIAQGYTNEQMIASVLFPEITVQKRTGKFPAFGKEAFKIYNTKRALRGKVAKMEVVTGSVLMELNEHALGFMIDDAELEESSLTGDVNQLTGMRQKMVSDSLLVEREYNAALLATTSGNYAASNKQNGGTAWASSGDPVADIQVWKEAIRKKIGRYPNTIVFDVVAWNLFINNQKVIDRVKYTQIPFIDESFAANNLLKLPNVAVGKSLYGTGSTGGVGETPLTMNDIWSSVQAGNVILAHVENGYGVPSYGYCYTLQGYPVVSAYRDEGRRSNVYDEIKIYNDAITLADAGFLAYNIV